MNWNKEFSISIGCRMIDSGGTSVHMYLVDDQIKCVWTNENCPYCDEDQVDAHGAALDGHNVSYIPVQAMERLLYGKRKKRRAR